MTYWASSGLCWPDRRSCRRRRTGRHSSSLPAAGGRRPWPAGFTSSSSLAQFLWNFYLHYWSNLPPKLVYCLFPIFRFPTLLPILSKKVSVHFAPIGNMLKRRGVPVGIVSKFCVNLFIGVALQFSFSAESFTVGKFAL